MSSTRPVHIGCSGWSYKDWRGVLYPEGLPAAKWLPRYAVEFSTVEVNNTFYRLPTTKAVEAWIEQTPPDFVFTLKISRYITHIKRLKEVPKYTRMFMERIKPLQGDPRQGPLLWQLPPNFKRDDERLTGALDALPPGRHAFEFRHESWFDAEVYALLRDHGVALVIADDPRMPFAERELTADWTLIRFHRGSRGRNGNYAAAEIDTWARRLRQWRRRVEVFAYFNNDQRGYAVKNAAALEKALGP
jgi:uncharacterized protein YecE (DUF72 family)